MRSWTTTVITCVIATLAVLLNASPAAADEPRSFAGCPLLSENHSTGPCVVRLQSELNIVNPGYGLAPDGVFGVATRIATLDFQGQSHLGADGLVGSMTADELDRQVAIRQPAASPAPASDPASDADAADVRALNGQLYGVVCDFNAALIKDPAIVASPEAGAITEFLGNEYDKGCRSGNFALSQVTAKEIVESLVGYVEDKALDVTFAPHIEAFLKKVRAYSAATAAVIGNVWNKLILDMLKQATDREVDCFKTHKFPAPECSELALINSLEGDLV